MLSCKLAIIKVPKVNGFGHSEWYLLVSHVACRMSHVANLPIGFALARLFYLRRFGSWSALIAPTRDVPLKNPTNCSPISCATRI